MKDASQFPVTLGYKAISMPQYGPGGTVGPYHRGIDYGCPVGTPVVVNGVTIGLSGATGAVTGPHLHVGRFVGGADTNPVGGFNFHSAVVTEIGSDSTNGKFVRIQGDGASWVYLHMSDNSKVKVGQELRGDINMPTTVDDGNIDLLYVSTLGRQATQADKDARRGQDYVKANNELYESQEWANRDKAAKTPGGVPPNTTQLKPGLYEVPNA